MRLRFVIEEIRHLYHHSASVRNDDTEVLQSKTSAKALDTAASVPQRKGL
jgi:hypothetical protein